MPLVASMFKWKPHRLTSTSILNPVLVLLHLPACTRLGPGALWQLCISRHFYCPWQTITVGWTHGFCPSAGCRSIKSIFLWKWEAVPSPEGGVEVDKTPSAIRFLFWAHKIRGPAVCYLKKSSHLTFRLNQSCLVRLAVHFSNIASKNLN